MADDSTYPAAMINATYSLLTNRPEFAMVIAGRDGFYDSIKFHITPARLMTTFHVGLFKLTAPTVMTKILTLGDVKALLNIARTLQVLSLPDPLDVVAGEVFYVGLLSNAGTPAVLFGSSNILPGFTGSPVTSGGSPELDMITTRTTTAAITSFAAATYTVLTTPGVSVSVRPWAALGNAIVLPRIPSFQVDTFNQINAPDLVLPWAFRSDLSLPTWGIYNDCASPNTGASGAFAYRVPSCRNNDHYAQIRLGADMATAATGGWDGDLYIGIRSGRGGAGTAVKLHIKPNGTKQFRLVTVTNAYNNGGLTQRAAMGGTIPDFAMGDVIKIAAQGSVYAAFLNDVPVVSWNDTGVLSPVDIDHQWVNIAASAVSAANLQLVDNFECGAYGGGVALIAPTSDASAEADGTLTFVNDVTPTPARATVAVISGSPTVQIGPAVTPAAARMEVISYAPTVLVPTVFQTDLVAKSNVNVPAAAVGCWVTLRGAGGGGGGGAATSTATYRYGGGGAGGGAYIKRFFLRRSQLGAKYTLTKGAGGNGGGPGPASGVDGGDSIFVSGTITVTAGGGTRGGAGGTASSPASAPGGTASASGITIGSLVTAPGGQGNGAGSGQSVTNSGAGGSSGGAVNASNGVTNGISGGDSVGASGGAGGTAHGQAGGTSSNQDLYGGGGGAGGAGWTNGNFAGGIGGNSGGGGGGAGATATAATNPGGGGGDGYVKVEWVS